MSVIDVKSLQEKIAQYLKKSGAMTPLFSLCSRPLRLFLVGGAVRDFLQGKETLDFDFEVHLVPNFSDDNFIDVFKSFFETFKTKFLPYNIVQVNVGSCELQFSLPRSEVFNLQEESHYNFRPTFHQRLDLKTSFQRRDFTINAMALELTKKEWIFHDPFGGYRDLMEKKLRPCNLKNFCLDPVRALRMLRMSIDGGFEFTHPEILSQFKLQGLSRNWIKKEMKKCSRPQEFLEQYHQLAEQLQQEVIKI